eukprot:3904451-Rhodomonas_salina.3
MIPTRRRSTTTSTTSNLPYDPDVGFSSKGGWLIFLSRYRLGWRLVMPDKWHSTMVPGTRVGIPSTGSTRLVVVLLLVLPGLPSDKA